MNILHPEDLQVAACLRYLPCEASVVPQNLRCFLLIENAGFAQYDNIKGVWFLTGEGKKFLTSCGKERRR